MHNPSGFGIYIHWPFCLSKCPYCDFNSHQVGQVDQIRWRDALLTELAHYAPQASGREVTSVFFGGGTPSLMDPASVQAVLEAICEYWPIARGIEITLEANPSTVEASRFEDFRRAGINRLSMGIQALNDPALKFLGRHHSVAEALSALEIARSTFDRISFDLIYARPDQSLQDWAQELTRALDFCADHLSVYQLTIEDGTAFAPRYKAGEFLLPDEPILADMFDLTQDILNNAGLPAYEVSNHARPGAECHHNLTYWLGGDYLGIGPGAHGRLWTLATRGIRSPNAWLAQVEASGHGAEEQAHMPALERAQEMLMTGLRLNKGIHRGLFKIVSGLDLTQVLDAQGLDHMVEAGFVISDDHTLRVTPAGFLLLNSVTQKLLA